MPRMRFAFVVALLGSALICAPSFSQQQYTLGPDSQVQANVPKGSVTKHELAPGRFYPGTPHTYWLYVPAGQDSSKAVPFMIFLDGSGFLRDSTRAPVVLDNLIAKKQIPPTVAIFIDPGVLPAVSDDVQSRYERIFEYDSLSSRFSSFLLEELVPDVEKSVPLSHSPDDHAIVGVSTGAVGAFMAAWNRPDQFHRVISFIGTYVAMKGADALPALVRKTEPKPIRIFMQDGKNDHIIPGAPFGFAFSGSWPINNQVMYEALEYGGYDATLVMGEGEHNTQQAAAILPDAIRWVWREYPQPIVVREPEAEKLKGWDPRGKPYSIVSGDQPWQKIDGSYGLVSGVTADDAGNAYFSDAAANRIYKVDVDGKLSVFREHTDGASALRVGADGRLYAFQASRLRIVAYGMNGEEKTIVSGVQADDFALTRSGAIYFVDRARAGIGVVGANGKVSRISVADTIAHPAGVALSPDQSLLVVTDAQSRFSWSFQIAPDGSLRNGESFYRLEMPEEGWNSNVTSVAEDSTGQTYYATPEGVQICEANGRVATILNAPEIGAVTALTFAGRDATMLYVAVNGKVYRRAVKVHGTSVANPVKPPKPPL
jgi:gluconolactonase